MEDSFSPLEAITRSIRYWWLLVIFMISGAVLGYLVITFLPPVYQTKANFSMVIDYTKTGKLTDTEEDDAIVTAGDVFLSASVVSGVIKDAGQAGIVITEAQFRKMVYAERTNSEWEITLRAGQADQAQKLMGIWTSQSMQAFRQGLIHAGYSTAYQHQLEGLVRCVEQIPSVAASAPVCGFNSTLDLQNAIKSVSDNEKKESELSLGLLSALNITQTHSSEAPESVRMGRNLAVLIGAITGLLVFISFNFFLSNRKNLSIKDE